MSGIFIALTFSVAFAIASTDNVTVTAQHTNSPCNCTTHEYSFQWHRRSVGRPGIEEFVHFSTAHTWSSTRLFRWEGSRQHDRTPTKIASALENFPATVNYAERLARLTQVPILEVLTRPGRDSNHTNNDLPDMKRAL